MPRPTSTHEQREAVRAVALQLGVREAARKLGLNESRVQAWSARYNWFPQRIPSDPKLAPLGTSDLVTIATNSANLLSEYGKTTKVALAKTVDKASERFSEYDGETIIAKSDRLVNVTNAASKIHQWEAGQSTSALNLNVLSGGRAIVQVNEKQTNENSE